MARRSATPPPPEDFEEHILDIDVGDEMRASFLEYAYSVIYSRALPDARDGLKPVQRRILYTMNDNGLRPDRGHIKSARVVGEVMGRLHPHGDGAIYDALVRLAQPWAMRLPMVDGHGNFGSPGGDDPPAAMRYTECRMAPAAVAMTASIDEDTVDFKPNYDSRELEPTVLPAAIPNLVVNGTTGIAVGMATNMAPHNLVEVVQALRHLITHPDADLDSLMRFIPGPDLPTGGKIVGLDGIKDAYETGRGSFRMRATARVETIGRRKGIVVTELPYAVGIEKVVERIKVLVQSKKLQGIADIKDLTDMANGTRLVVEVKNGFHPEAILEQLYRQTPMEESFGINNVCLVDGQPRTLGLKELLEVFLEHRYTVVRRRSQFRRDKKAERLHLVDGLLIALVDIDEVIQVIRTSDDSGAAKERLISVFDLSDAQATYILDMQLRRLTRFSRIELEKEQETLRREIEELEAILGDEALLRRVVSDELAEVAKTYGTPRRTVLLGAAGSPPATGRAGRGRRRPVLRVAVLQRAAGPQRVGRAARATAGTGPTTTSSSPSVADHGPRRDRRADLPRPAGQARRPRPVRGDTAPVGQPPQPQRVPAGQRDAPARAGRAGAGAVHAGHRRSRDRPRHPGRHRQAGQPRGHRQGRVGRHRAQGRRRGRRGRPARHRPRDALLHHHRRPAAALRRRRRPAAGPRRRRACRASGWPPGERVAWFGARRPDGLRRGDGVRVHHRPARHRARARSR